MKHDQDISYHLPPGLYLSETWTRNGLDKACVLTVSDVPSFDVLMDAECVKKKGVERKRVIRVSPENITGAIGVLMGDDGT